MLTASQKSLRARKLRRALVRELGGKCTRPGCKTRSKLEINHVNGRDWHLSKTSSYNRVLRYWREYRAGVSLNVLCRKHNGSFNPHRDLAPALPDVAEPVEEAPF